MITKPSVLLGRFVLVLILGTLSCRHTGGPRVSQEGRLPDDARLQPLKELDGYFPFNPPATKVAWEKRSADVRRRILVAEGLWPMPAKTSLNAVIHGRIDREDYSVEKVFFESAPGFFVTGNLYRPRVVKGKVPGVLFAHGHWANARLSESGDAEILREIAEGQERFEEGGRSRFQSLCVQLARMGCVVWQWDMLSDSDSVQFSRQMVHGFSKQRPEMNTVTNWGLYSPQAEMHLQSVMGLQTWNAVRSLDFLLSLPEIDPDRIGVTGASGGGTQTFILAAIDPRVTLAFPAVMVSTAMQGGCTCENASLLRVDTGNIEIAGLFAPKPLGMTTANDWTKEMSIKGFPELKKLYALLGAPNNVMLHRGEHFPHNYNAVSRHAFYGWVNKHFKLGAREPVIERDYQRLTHDELSVWDAMHPAPKAADPEFERRLLRTFHEDAQRQLADAASSPTRFQEIAGRGLEVVIGRTLADTGEVRWEMLRKTDRGTWIEMSGLLRNTSHQEELPVLFCYPKKWNGTTVVWLTGKGKSALQVDAGAIAPDAQKLLDAGATVLGVDLMMQGEFLADGRPVTKTATVKNPREAAAYTFGYNHSLFAQRVHDVLTAIQFIRTFERPTKQLVVVGFEGAGPLVAAARAVSGDAIDRAVIDTGGFRFGGVLDIHSPEFLPGGAKYGDVPGMLALASSGSTLLFGETTSPGPGVRLGRSSDPSEARAEALRFILAK
ncbi:MAG: hypothetical protein QOF48_1655 [Verrucomicrobiota bacterium]|jgi:dienelactone hydrolase